jgi:adenosylcobinamide-phosphate synthase
MDDAGLHRSPNAGWPESAFAAVMNISLGGPRIYDGDQADEPYMNAAGRDALRVIDIDRAVGLFWLSLTVATVFVGVLALII